MQEISSQHPEAKFFHPSLVFVATWDRVAAFSSDFSGLVNTFQVTIVSNGTWTFVRFSYGDIQWGGADTLIGVSAGDRSNFVTHPASLSQSALLLDDTSVIYRFDSKFPLPSVSSHVDKTSSLPIQYTLLFQVIKYVLSLKLADESGVFISDNFLPFGPAHGDSVTQTVDDGSSEGIRFGTDVIIFGLRQNRLYVSHIMYCTYTTSMHTYLILVF